MEISSNQRSQAERDDEQVKRIILLVVLGLDSGQIAEQCELEVQQVEAVLAEHKERVIKS